MTTEIHPDASLPSKIFTDYMTSLEKLVKAFAELAEALRSISDVPAIPDYLKDRVCVFCKLAEWGMPVTLANWIVMRMPKRFIAIVAEIMRRDWSREGF